MKALSVILLSLCLVFSGCAMPGAVSGNQSTDVMVAVGAGGMIARSLDHGRTWETVMGFKSQVFKKTNVEIDGNLKVNGELNGGRFAQIDSLASVVSQIQGNFTNGFSGDLYAKGNFYQQLGQSWVGPIANSFGGASIFGVAYGGGNFVAVGNTGLIELSTTLGSTWVAVVGGNNPFNAGGSIPSVAYGGGSFVAVASAGQVGYSTNLGVSWTLSASALAVFGAHAVQSLAYGNGIFVATSATGGLIAISQDLGVTWTSIANPFTAAGDAINGVTFGNGIFIAIGSNVAYHIAYSNATATVWTFSTNPLTLAPESVAFGNGVFVVGGQGQIVRSVNNGITWGSLIANPFGAASIAAMAYNFGIFQAGAAGGLTARSYDSGVTWGPLVTNPFGTNIIYSIASSPLNMVAVGAAGSIATAGWNAAYSLVNPVAAEQSLGTPHPTSDANRLTTVVVNTAINTQGVWSAAVTMTGVPLGAKAAWCVCSIGGVLADLLCVEAATGYTLSDIFAVPGTAVKYWSVTNEGTTTAVSRRVLKIHLDANGQFKWCTNVTNSTVQIYSAIDYEM